MVNVFRPVPDWVAWDNQGGGVAVGSLSGDASQDLVVLAVDNPAGQNQGRYRVGRALDSSGQVTGGWGPWINVPDWFAYENQGANIALADLDGDGRQELVVAMVDNPGGQNRGLFRIGRQLDAIGNVGGGWTPWVEVPDWFSWENQGIGIALTPADQQGTRDLIVAMVDGGPQANRGLYRLGSGLDVDGNVGGWTPWIEVPDWFSWENQGCGVTVADLDRDGGRDLVVAMVDNPVGQNQAFYRVGTDLDADGLPAGGWGPWLGVPNWFAWENQGGGITVAELDDTLRLVAFMIDNPPQQNAGLYQLLDLEHDPATYGSWEELAFHSGVLAVHAALLPNGKVLFFAGSGSSATRFNSPIFGDEGQGIFTSVVWTPPDNSFSHPPTLRTANQRPYDLFCGGDGFLADGRMLSAGGTLDYNPFRGRSDTAIFDFATEQWSFAATMAQGRWYPTLIPLGDGTILAASGLGEHGNDQPKTTLELYSAATNSWRTRQLAPGFPGLPLYAHLFLLADGRVFFSGGRMDDPLEVAACLLDLTDDPVSAITVPDLLAPDMRNQSASVLLPPAQDQRVMIVGGGPVGIPNKTDATDAVSIVDLTAPNPVYQAGTPIGLPRLHLNAVLLPDRTVFVSGGSLKQEDEPLARLQAELYDPATGSWSLMATATVPRLYHSTALLLADGRVVAAGGNPEGGDQVAWEPPSPVEELRVEVFSPPYLFKGPRPVIGAVPQEWSYAQTMTIPTPQAPGIRWASLIKNGVTTHSFDSGQRLINLEIVTRANNSLQVTVTPNPNLAPPGWYMLFLVDQQGVPSVATWIHLT
jgi:galactose oxidase-like protein